MKYFVLHGFGFAMDYFMISNHWFTWFTTFIQMDIRERGDLQGKHNQKKFFEIIAHHCDMNFLGKKEMDKRICDDESTL